MTESPPRSEMPPEQDAATPPFRVPSALPVSPWWSTSEPEAARDREPDLGAEPVIAAAEEILEAEGLRETASPSLAEGLPASPSTTEGPPVQEPFADVRTVQKTPADVRTVQKTPADVRTVQVAPAEPPPLPRPARKRRRKGLLAAFCVVLVLGVLAATAVVALVTMRPEPEGIPIREVSAAAMAGGLRRDDAIPEAGAAYPFLIAAVRAAGVEHAVTATGVYRDPAGGRDVLFLGGAAAIGDPAPFLWRARPSTVLNTEKAASAGRDGQVACGTFAVLSETHLYCVWATENSFGFVASNEPARAERPAGFAALIARMRADLEKTAR
jgi:hypothetical protein